MMSEYTFVDNIKGEKMSDYGTSIFYGGKLVGEYNHVAFENSVSYWFYGVGEKKIEERFAYGNLSPRDIAKMHERAHRSKHEI